MIQLGIDSFALSVAAPGRVAVPPGELLVNLFAEIELAAQVGLDVLGIGEHHRAEFVDSAPAVILGAAAARTKRRHLLAGGFRVRALVRDPGSPAALRLAEAGAELAVGDMDNRQSLDHGHPRMPSAWFERGSGRPDRSVRTRKT